MNKHILIVGIIAILATSGIGLANAQNDTQTEEPEIAFSEFQIWVFGIGALAGFVTAYNGYARKKRQLGEKFTFDRSAFLDRVFMAVLASIPLAVAESANIVKLDLFGAWIIFAAALGTTELIMEIRNRKK